MKGHLGVNLRKYVQDLYAKSRKMLIKKIEGDLNKSGDMLCSWIGRFNIMKTSISLISLLLTGQFKWSLSYWVNRSIFF